MKAKLVKISECSQTLIEVVIATGVIVVVLVGCLSLAAMTIKVGTLTKQKNQALNLASQGIEGIRNIRDTYWLEGTDQDVQWQAFLAEYYNNGTVGDFNIQYNETEGKWEKTTDFTEDIGGFTLQRKIKIEDVDPPSDNKKKVTVTINWDGKSIKNVSYLTNWIGVGNEPPPSEPCFELPPDPISWWSLDEGSGITATDSIGSNDGTLEAEIGPLPEWTTTDEARVGNSALRFDSTKRNYVCVPDATSNPSLDITGDITVEAWAKFSDINTKQAIVGKKEGWAAYTLRINQEDVITDEEDGVLKHPQQLCFFVEGGDYAKRYTVFSNTQVEVDKWYHVVGVRNGTDLKIYVNGNLENTDSAPLMTENNRDLFIGGDPRGADPGSLNYPFSGTIDEVKIYNVALNANQICYIYNNPPTAPPPPIPPTNVALASNGGQVTNYSHQFDERGYASYLIDGKIQFNTNYTGWWIKNPTGTEYAVIKFNNTYSINQINHYNDGQYGAKSVTVKYSLDGTSWNTLGTWNDLTTTASTPNKDTFTFDPVQTQYVRFEYTSFNNSSWLQIDEIEIFSGGT